jgi:hypothetical protein
VSRVLRRMQDDGLLAVERRAVELLAARSRERSKRWRLRPILRE